MVDRRPTGASGRKPARQADIARLAGVSQWTVSRVVNDRGDEAGIPRATQERIREVAAGLGYSPNLAARTLRGGRTSLIGIHAYQPTLSVLQGTYFHDYLVGIEREVERAGCDLVLFSSLVGSGGDGHAYRGGSNRLALADGSIILGFHTDRAELGRLLEEGYRFVHIGRREIGEGHVPFVSPDYRAAAQDVVATLADAGHRGIGYVIAERPSGRTDEPHRDRFAGFAAGCVARRLSPDLAVVPLREVDAGWVAAVTESGVTALVVEDEPSADVVARAARRAKVSLPDRLSVAVLGDARGGPRRGLTWTSTAMPRTEVGALAVRRLLAVIEGTLDPAEVADLVPCGPPVGDTVAVR